MCMDCIIHVPAPRLMGEGVCVCVGGGGGGGGDEAKPEQCIYTYISAMIKQIFLIMLLNLYFLRWYPVFC